MGAKKPVIKTTRQTRCVLGKMKTRLGGNAKLSKPRPVAKVEKPTDKASTSVKKQDTKDLAQKISTPKTVTAKTPSIKTPKYILATSTCSSTVSIVKPSSSTGSPKKSPTRQKPNDDKSKAINKMLKNLDIKISGFKNIVPEEEKEVICKASISEIVKTKSRAAAPKLGSGGLGKSVRKDESAQDVSKKCLTKIQTEATSIEMKKTETKESKSIVEEPRKERKGRVSSKERIDSVKKTEDKTLVNPTSGPKEQQDNDQKNKEQTKLAVNTSEDYKFQFPDPNGVKSLHCKTEEDKKKNDSQKPSLEKPEKEKILNKQQKKLQKAPPDKKEQNKNENVREKSPAKNKPAQKKQKETTQNKSETYNLQQKKTALSSLPEKGEAEQKAVSPKKSKEMTMEKLEENKSVKKPAETAKEKTNQLANKVRQKAKPKPKDNKTENQIQNSKEKTNKASSIANVKQPQIEKKPENISPMIPETKIEHKITKTEVISQSKNVELSVQQECLIPPGQTINKTSNKKVVSTKSTAMSKLLSVRERLQKKYVRDKGSGFKAFKANKQLKSVKKSIVTTTTTKNSTIVQSEIVIEKKIVEDASNKQEKDIYDFKTESESDDNIKMNLLSEAAVLSKIQLDKDFSDEDNKPLKKTKEQLEDEEDEKPLSQCKDLKKPLAIKIKEEVKIEKKQKIVKIVKAKPVKRAPVAKRKEISESSNSNSDSDSETDDSEANNRKLKSRRQPNKKVTLMPKHHRMASLNALAKVQCLYENESRTAHELGLSKSSQIPRIRIINSGSSSDEEGNDKEKKGESVTKDALKEEPTQEVENKRELRNAPGQRGIGKHWDFNDSFESGHESDIIFRKSLESKNKKRKIVKPKPTKKEAKEKSEIKPKKPVKVQKKKPRAPLPKASSASSDEDGSSESSASHKSSKNKRKSDDVANEIKPVLANKRMASLNASAIVAATYEVERHLDRNLDSDCSSFESFPEEEKYASMKTDTPKKLSEPIKVDPAEEANKECNRPTSSSVVIVQDTDVTITGVYVNSSTGSSQEAYCKMQYRVQSSVTEERVLRPSSIDPPKSYTPLGALSSMRPPGAATATGPLTTEGQQPQPELTPNAYHTSVANQEPLQSNPHIYPNHHHQQQPIQQEQLHHIHHQQQQQQQQQQQPPPLKYHHLQHHHHQQPPIAQPRCESPLRYPPSAYQNVQAPMPPPTLSISGGGSSAFCAPMQQSHHDMSGYYQPAGPLISPHILPSVPSSNASLVSAKQIPSPLDSEPDQLQQPPQSTSTAESSDSEVLITGGDLTTFRYPSQQQQQQQQQQSQSLSALSSSQQQNSPYSRPIHQMHYTPAYPPSYYSPYPGDAMCYPPSYQPYFPPKVYQSAPTYRRYQSYYQPGHPPPSDIYDPPPPTSAQGPPPPSGSQLVPAGPTGPQHIEHYSGPPGFYSGYSPGGGQCYSRGMQPPYMEYPAPCPCPMQSCPKNVLTGPLIGSNSSGSSNTNSSGSANNIGTTSNNNANSISSNNNNSSSLSTLNQQLKTSKGPVQHSLSSHNHIMGQIEPTNATNGASIIGKPLHHHHHMHQCKIEIMDPLKAELKSELNNEIKSNENRKNSQYEETVIPPTPPSSYTVNDKLIEPEITLSPARGSTGLPTVPDQADNAAVTLVNMAANASQPSKAIANLSGDSETNSTSIPSIIGRKARIGKSMAREMMYRPHTLNYHHTPLETIFNSHSHIHHHLPSHNPVEANNPLPESNDVASIKQQLDKIKKEEIKTEEEDDVVILEDEIKNVKSEPDIVEVIDQTSIKSSDQEDSVPQTSSKRIKILGEQNKGQSKKSPQNSYKSLIKQTEPKPYLCLSRKSEKKNRFRKYQKSSAKGGIRKRKLMLTEQQKKRLFMRKRKLMMIEKRRQAAAASNKSTRKQLVEEATTQQQDSASIKIKTDKNSPKDYTIDCMARGYFSEPDIRASSSRKTKKTRSTEARSKSETKKSQTNVPVATSSGVNATISKPKLPANEENTTDENSSKSCKKTKYSGKCTKTKTKPQKTCTTFEQNDLNVTTYNNHHQDTSQNTIESTSNNNNIFEHNNNNSHNNNNKIPTTNSMLVNPFEIPSTTTCRVSTSTSWNGKRSRPRASKFGSKKRPRYRQNNTFEVAETIIIPRKSNVVPRWNNGWSWEGEPFQGKIFFNSDDPLVVRTCYPAMRHSEGDVIRPRDCVLLRAGSKKNELPYVAKVAHLWENPEDGEMMMSLLWYYRPEHTEQGRQSHDSADEVFASRHRDHNSVACIEDKCYVLTFSEYCRYRRSVRAVEEGIEEQPSIVPILQNYYNPREVPVNTNPEQVLFCQRVYEFRLKRLKTSSS